MKQAHRIKQTGEVFTPPKLVDEIVDKLPTELFVDNTKTFIDPAMGDGEFLRGVVRRLQKEQTNFNLWHTIDNQLYGVELMWDNTCDALYFLITEDNHNVRIPDPVIQDGFSDEPADNATPEDINELFTEIRKYRIGSDELWVRKADNHHMEFAFKSEGIWETVQHIIRANALTEWDFDNWKPAVETKLTPKRKTKKVTKKAAKRKTKKPATVKVKTPVVDTTPTATLPEVTNDPNHRVEDILIF